MLKLLNKLLLFLNQLKYLFNRTIIITFVVFFVTITSLYYTFPVKAQLAVLSPQNIGKAIDIVIEISKRIDWHWVESRFVSNQKKIIITLKAPTDQPFSEGTENLIEQYLNHHLFRDSFEKFKLTLTNGLITGLAKSLTETGDLTQGCNYRHTENESYAGSYVDGGLPCGTSIIIRNVRTDKLLLTTIRVSDLTQEEYEKTDTAVYLSPGAMTELGLIDGDPIQVQIAFVN